MRGLPSFLRLRQHADEHRLIGGHVAGAETRSLTEGGCVVDEWKSRPSGPDNCATGHMVYALIREHGLHIIRALRSPADAL
jgi:hypothetical protein